MKPDDLPLPNYDPGRYYTVGGRLLNTLIKAAVRRTPKAGDNVRIAEDLDGFTIHAAGGTAPASCYWGNVIEYSGDHFLSSGILQAGPDIYNVAPFTIPTGTDGTLYVWLSCDIVVNTEDGILLPGIASSSAPTWHSGAVYPSQTIPTAPDGEGTAIIPIAEVIIAGGVPTADPAACSHLALTHCPGTLSVAPYLA